MKYITFAFVALSAFSAFASTPDFEALDLAQQIGSSKFETLISYYNQGHKPQEAELAGLRSGREYAKAAPNSALGTILYCDRYKSGENDGPLFSGTAFSCVNGGADDAEKTNYDNGLKQSEFDYFLPLLKKLSINLDAKDVCFNNTAQWGASSQWAGQECYRQYKSYLVYVVTSLKDGNVLRAGYFFKKVAVNN